MTKTIKPIDDKNRGGSKPVGGTTGMGRTPAPMAGGENLPARGSLSDRSVKK